MAESSANAGSWNARRLAKGVARRLFGWGRPPRVGHVSWGDFARSTPISGRFGYDRGGPIDRYYIEQFLETHAADVRGRLLEVKDDEYTRRFGNERVTRSDVLDIDETNANATLIIDLNDAVALPSESFDCIILTQTMQYVFDVPSAVANLHRCLAPGGVLLLTVPGITRVTQSLTWYWSFTDRSIAKLLEAHFVQGVETVTFGNLRTTTGFLYGLGVTELSKRDLDHADPDYQLIVAARAVKA